MIATHARGDWKELESRLRPYVARRLATSADVDDVLQEIFVKLHQGLAALRDGERFGAWVYRIARSVLVDRSRSLLRHPTVALPAEVDALADSTPEDDEHLQVDLASCMAGFVSRLPAAFRSAVTLTELQGLSQKEAAEMLGLSVSGVKSRVQRGRDKLRAMLDDCCRVSVDGRGRVVDYEPRAPACAPAGCGDQLVSLSLHPPRR
jgi:RNA polymerase sigma-70 factor (ECF subfamily)